MNAQTCNLGEITLSSQAEVDDFPTDYPGCTQILGSITISGADITDLSGLFGVTYLEGNLFIEDNPMLNSLAGLESLTTIFQGGFFISNNAVLTSLMGLESLNSIGNEFFIIDNPALTSLTALESLTSIGTLFYSQNNDALTSLEGLGSLTSVQGLYILSNDALTSLGSFDALTSLNDGLFIENNNALLSLTGLEPLIFIGGLFRLFDNPALSSLNGLESLTSVGSIEMRNNSSLMNLTGLESLTFIYEYLDLYNNDALTSLTGLESLASINNYLYLQNHDALVNLTGLESLADVSVIRVENNDALINLTGLESLTSVSSIELLNNNALVDLTGLESITSIEHIEVLTNNSLKNLTGLESLTNIVSGVTLADNPSLMSLTGLEAVATVGNLGIISNTALTSLAELESLVSIEFGLTIVNNSTLSVCEITAICDYVSVSSNSNITIWGNAPGCNSRTEVEAACDAVNCPPIPVTISGNNCFYGATTRLTASPGAGHTYLWNTNEATRGINVGSGTYCVTVTETSTGCSETACITVCKAPTIAISPVRTTTICSGECITLKAMAGNSSTYQWSNSGPASATWTVCPTAPSTTYTVTVTNDAGCTASKSIRIRTDPCYNDSGCENPPARPEPGNSEEPADINSDNAIEKYDGMGKGINTRSNSNGLVHAYPNPASNELILDYAEKVAEIEALAFHDLNGRKLFDVKLSGTGISQLDVSMLPPGLYVLKINGTIAMRIALAQ